MLADQPPQLADELGVATGGQIGVGPCLHRLEPLLLESWQRISGERLPGEVEERFAAPQLERRPQRARRILGPSLFEKRPAFVAEAFEPGEIDLLGIDREHIAGRPRLEHLVRLEELPEPGDVLLESGGGVLGWIAAPELLDQPVARDHPARIEQEQGEEAALLGPTQANHPLALAHLERAEDGEVKGGGQTATVPRVSAA